MQPAARRGGQVHLFTIFTAASDAYLEMIPPKNLRSASSPSWTARFGDVAGCAVRNEIRESLVQKNPFFEQ